MYSNKLSNMTRGWFVGDFEPSIYRTNDAESAVRVLEKGYCEQAHFHRAAVKVIVVLSGKLYMFGKEWNEDDIVVFEPGDVSSIKALQDSKIIVMMLPGIKNDKVYVDSETQHGDLGLWTYSTRDIRKILNIMGSLLAISNISLTDGNGVDKTVQDYIKMQKREYENPDITPENIVGQYDWHEEYPYETFLLYRNGDVRKPIFEYTKDKIALDFACGPEEW